MKVYIENPKTKEKLLFDPDEVTIILSLAAEDKATIRRMGIQTLYGAGPSKIGTRGLRAALKRARKAVDAIVL